MITLFPAHDIVLSYKLEQLEDILVNHWDLNFRTSLLFSRWCYTPHHSDLLIVLTLKNVTWRLEDVLLTWGRSNLLRSVPQWSENVVSDNETVMVWIFCTFQTETQINRKYVKSKIYFYQCWVGWMGGKIFSNHFLFPVSGLWLQCVIFQE